MTNLYIQTFGTSDEYEMRSLKTSHPQVGKCHSTHHRCCTDSCSFKELLQE